MRRMLGSSGGFTYIAVLVMVIVMGILAERGAVVWKTVMQREKETELLSRGTQVRDAMRRWYQEKTVPGKEKTERADPKAPPVPNLPDLKALTINPSTPGGTPRYLRPSALIDPMNPDDDGEWVVIRDASQKIIGVHSKSEKVPLKQGNFPFDLHPADFEKKSKYSDWHFIYNRVPPAEDTANNDPNKPVPPAGM